MKKRSKQEIEYAKNIKRIKQFIRRAEKRGYEFTQNVIPKKPKKITQASVNKLQKITPSKLYEKSIFVNKETGELVTGKKGRIIEKERSTQKAKETRKRKKQIALQKKEEQYNQTKKFVENESKTLPKPSQNIPTINLYKVILTNFTSMISSFPTQAYPFLKSWLNAIISTYGEEKTAEMIKNGMDSGLILTYEIAYSSDLLRDYTDRMLDYMPEVGEFSKEELNDALDLYETWEDFDD